MNSQLERPKAENLWILYLFWRYILNTRGIVFLPRIKSRIYWVKNIYTLLIFFVILHDLVLFFEKEFEISWFEFRIIKDRFVSWLKGWVIIIFEWILLVILLWVALFQLRLLRSWGSYSNISLTWLRLDRLVTLWLRTFHLYSYIIICNH